MTTLTSSVTDLLANQNPAAANRFARQFHPDTRSEKEELCALNRFWREELLAVHASTVSARSCLVDDIDARSWLRHFRSLVLPTIVQHNLPAC